MAQAIPLPNRRSCVTFDFHACYKFGRWFALSEMSAMEPIADTGAHERRLLREIYDTFFFRTFRAPRAIWKFVRTWIAACLRPGLIDPERDCGPDKRYVGAIRFAESLFGLAIAAAIGGFISQDIGDIGETLPRPNSEISDMVLAPVRETADTGPRLATDFSNFLVRSFENAYVLWLYCSALIAGVLASRVWAKLTKSDGLSRFQLTSLFIYEFGVLFLPLLVIIYVFEYTIFDIFTGGIEAESEPFFEGDLIFTLVHFLLFLSLLGRRARIPVWRSIWSSVVVIFVLSFLFLISMLVSIPFYMLPFLLLLYPIYAFLRDYIPKPAFAKRIFLVTESRIDASQFLLNPEMRNPAEESHRHQA